jgi:DNA-binding MurR/RpiR family transcriptional regulator
LIIVDILGKIKQPHFFSNSEQGTIDFILNNPDFLKKATVKELATATFTSPSTIVRLCQKLGCKNYSDFKMQFVSSLENRNYTQAHIDANFPFDKNNTFLGSLCCEAINETLSLIDGYMYEKAIDLIYTADCIDIYGVGVNQSIAHDFKMNLMRINKKVNIAHDNQQLTVSAAYSNKKHASLIISYTGETAETIKYCKILKQTGSPMICITNIGNNTISDLCDISLKMVTREKMFSKIGIFSSKFSIMLILDILYSGIFSKNYDENVNLTIQKRKITSALKSNMVSFLGE